MTSWDRERVPVLILAICLMSWLLLVSEYGLLGERKINFGDKVNDVDSYNHIRIDAFVSNIMAKDGKFCYIADSCYKSEIKSSNEYSKICDYIPVYAEDKVVFENTQKVVTVKGELEVATENHYDYIVFKSKDKIRTVGNGITDKSKKKLMSEYDEAYYVFADDYGKLSPIKIVNARIINYDGKNIKIKNFNKNIEDGFLDTVNDALQQIYEKCNNNDKYKIDSTKFDEMRKNIKEQGKDVLGYKGLNKLLSDIHSILESAKTVDTKNKESLNEKANNEYTSFQKYVTEIKLNE